MISTEAEAEECTPLTSSSSPDHDNNNAISNNANSIISKNNHNSSKDVSAAAVVVNNAANAIIQVVEDGHDDDNNDNNNEDDTVGSCTTYHHYHHPPIINPFRITGRYSGYCTLLGSSAGGNNSSGGGGGSSIGRVSMLDLWDFDTTAHEEDCENDNYNNGGRRRRRSRKNSSNTVDNSSSSSAGEEEEDESGNNGDFVSFWRHDNDSSSSSCSSSSSENDGEKQQQGATIPPHLNITNGNNNNNSVHDDQKNDDDDDDEDDDDLVEMTMRPIPLLYRKYQGGMGMRQNTHAYTMSQNNSSTLGNNDNGNNAATAGSWFQKELGVANLHFNPPNVAVSSSSFATGNSGYGGGNSHTTRRRRSRSRRRQRPLWGLGRRRQTNNKDYEDDNFDNSEDEEDEYEAIINNDTNSLLASKDYSSEEEIGQCTSTLTSREQLQFFCHDQSIVGGSAHLLNHVQSDDNTNNNIFGGRRRRRRRGDNGGGGILSLPMVRPFLLGTRRGFSDRNESMQEDYGNHDDDDDDANNIHDYAEDDTMPSRQDREAVVQSISQGIRGIKDDSLLLLDNDDRIRNYGEQQQNPQSGPPNLLQRIFLTRFLQPPSDGTTNHQHSNNQSSIIQLHNLLRNEDWSLASQLLTSQPHLSQTWHNITRLYDGKYDGAALPIHAACALHPPPSFITMLANLYKRGLMEKDKAFGRVPLHVACRCLSESGVVRVLCEMSPECVVARDSLKRVPLHYLVKNYCTFGDDDDDISLNSDDNSDDNDGKETGDNHDHGHANNDGMIALKILLKTNPSCVRAADHRGWLPIHVAASCSSRKGMIPVLKLLLKVWPESIYETTEKDTDALGCVEMAGKVHPTKERVILLLTEAKRKLLDEVDDEDEDNVESAAVDDDAGDSIPESTGRKDFDTLSQHNHRESKEDDDADKETSADDSKHGELTSGRMCEEKQSNLKGEGSSYSGSEASISCSGETHLTTPCPERDEELLIDL